MEQQTAPFAAVLQYEAVWSQSLAGAVHDGRRRSANSQNSDPALPASSTGFSQNPCPGEAKGSSSHLDSQRHRADQFAPSHWSRLESASGAGATSCFRPLGDLRSVRLPWARLRSVVPIRGNPIVTRPDYCLNVILNNRVAIAGPRLRRRDCPKGVSAPQKGLKLLHDGTGLNVGFYNDAGRRQDSPFAQAFDRLDKAIVAPWLNFERDNQRHPATLSGSSGHVKGGCPPLADARTVRSVALGARSAFKAGANSRSFSTPPGEKLSLRA